MTTDGARRADRGRPSGASDRAGSPGRGAHVATPGADTVVETVLRWAREYLCNPHPHLGRRGPVCPYVPASLASGRFHVLSHVQPNAGPSAVGDAVRHCRRLLLAKTADARRDPGGGSAALHTTVLLTFPALDPVAAQVLVEDVQRCEKTAFVEQGLMIGEFHPGPPPAAGLHNPRFRPLASPVPLLAMRHMVAADEPFLRDDPAHAAAYTRRFASGGLTSPAADLRERP